MDFSNWIYPTEKEQNVRAFVVKRIVDSIQLAFPECRVSPFGSYNTMLYTPDAYDPSRTFTESQRYRHGRELARSCLDEGVDEETRSTY